MLEGGEADLGVDDIVFFQLIEEIEGGYAQLLFCLHEFDLANGSFDIVGEIDASFGGDEFVAIGFWGDGGIDAVNGLVAEAAVEVEMEFDLWKGFDLIGLRFADFGFVDLGFADLGLAGGGSQEGDEGEEEITHS